MTNHDGRKSLARLLAGPVLTVGLADGREAVRAALADYAAGSGLLGGSAPAPAPCDPERARPEAAKAPRLPGGLSDDELALLEADPELASQFRAKLQEFKIGERRQAEDRRYCDEFWASADARSKVDQMAERVARELAERA